MEEVYKRKEDFEQAYEDLDKEDKKELEEIGKELKKYKEKPNLPIEDKNLKKRIAKICSKLIEETPNDKTSIMETSYIITGNFVWKTYGDKLDEAMDIAGELELPEEHVTSGNVLDMWNKMKKIFQQYLSE
jgi:dsRNA-specific ribonuclease